MESRLQAEGIDLLSRSFLKGWIGLFGNVWPPKGVSTQFGYKGPHATAAKGAKEMMVARKLT
jgi:hypothetical protein